MRKGFVTLCSKIDLDGVPSKYYPRFRPRRLVMPVNPDDIHSARRQKNQLFEQHKGQQRRQREATKRGALKLASVPPERTVADAFRVMLDVCEKDGLFHTGPGATMSSSLQALRDRLGVVRSALPSTRVASAAASAEVLADGSPFYATVLDPRRDLARSADAHGTQGLSVRRVDSVWSLLERTPLNSPVHGVLAQRGKALTERYISALAYQAYPRLRSKHLQALLHETCGLLPSSRVAMRLGFADVAAVETDIGLWRELNILTLRFQDARRKATQHLQRVEKGVATQRRWYWRGVLRSAAGRLKHFPADRADLQPRLEWVRGNVFAFIAFLSLAEESGDVGVKVEPVIGKLFCAQLLAFVETAALVRDVDAALASARAYLAKPSEVAKETPEHSSVSEDAEHSGAERPTDTEALADAVAALERERALVRQRGEDEESVLDGRSHPLNDRADRRREQFESTAGAHGTQTLKDDLFDNYRTVQHAHQAPPMMLNATSSHNALKEIQLILKYAADVAPALRGAPLDVDQVIRQVVEVHETNAYATLPSHQQYRTVEYTVCRLYAGSHCLGEGKGETLMEAIQEAAQDAVYNYYLNSAGKGVESSTATDDHSAVDTSAAETVRVRSARTEEEISL